MENFPEHAKRKTFSGTSRLFSCIILTGTRSNGTGFLFWVSTPWHFIRCILCTWGCIFQISHLFSLGRYLSLCCLWAMFCCTDTASAYNRLLVIMKDRPAWKWLSCYWEVWISLLMPCNSLSIFFKIFFHFIILEDLSFAVPVNRVFLAYVRVLNDWSKDFLLPAGGLFLAPSTVFLLVFFVVVLFVK